METTEMDDKTVLVSLAIMDEKLEKVLDTLERFTALMERCLPLLERYENGGAVGMLFGKNTQRREMSWPKTT